MKWQPVVLIVDERIECVCGSLATFITGKVVKDTYNVLTEVDVWCQDCFTKAQEKDTE